MANHNNNNNENTQKKNIDIHETQQAIKQFS